MPPVSRLPKVLPLTELAALVVGPGVIGGVESGKGGTEELVAATLGTFPSVGVGFVAMSPTAVCAKDDCVATEEAELDLLGLAGRAVLEGVAVAARTVDTLPRPGVDALVGVTRGDGWVELEIDRARAGGCG